MNIINANKKSDGSLYSVPLVFDFSSLTYFSYEGNYEVDDLFNADGGITINCDNEYFQINGLSVEYMVNVGSRRIDELSELFNCKPLTSDFLIDKFSDMHRN